MRAGESCVAAPASRRGGDFSSYRRQKQKQDNRNPANTIQERVPAVQEDETEAKPDDPLYAELTNPGDALQILARLAASDSQPPVQAGQSSSVTATGHELLTSDRGHVNNLSAGQGILQSNVADDLLSDTEALVMSILGLDTTKNLLQQYVDPCSESIEIITDLLAIPQTIIRFRLLRPSHYCELVIYAKKLSTSHSYSLLSSQLLRKMTPDIKEYINSAG